MELIINNRIIGGEITPILELLKSQTNYKYFKNIRGIRNGNVQVTCPFHKDGQENKPSCYIFNEHTSNELQFGTCHCFTCGAKTSLTQVVAHCFESDLSYAEQWLYDNFGDTLVERDEILPEINIDNKPVQKHFLDETILDKFNHKHPYMYQRKLTDEVINKFKIGYDKETDSIVFPVWDETGHLVTITKRSVAGKRFQLEENVDKPVYLLNYVRKNNITSVYVVESQINALTLWSWGYPAVALFGTGSKYQYQILRKSGIRNYILCFDGDDAGVKGRNRFIQNMPKDVMVSYKNIPSGKDVNDLDKETFEKLPEI